MTTQEAEKLLFSYKDKQEALEEIKADITDLEMRLRQYNVLKAGEIKTGFSRGRITDSVAGAIEHKEMLSDKLARAKRSYKAISDQLTQIDKALDVMLDDCLWVEYHVLLWRLVKRFGWYKVRKVAFTSIAGTKEIYQEALEIFAEVWEQQNDT